MLQDYNHRAQYFPEIISSARLLCRSGDERFGFAIPIPPDSLWRNFGPALQEKSQRLSWA